MEFARSAVAKTADDSCDESQQEFCFLEGKP
jgi:hypothetical protein